MTKKTGVGFGTNDELNLIVKKKAKFKKSRKTRQPQKFFKPRFSQKLTNIKLKIWEIEKSKNNDEYALVRGIFTSNELQDIYVTFLRLRKEDSWIWYYGVNPNQQEHYPNSDEKNLTSYVFDYLENNSLKSKFENQLIDSLKNPEVEIFYGE